MSEKRTILQRIRWNSPLWRWLLAVGILGFMVHRYEGQFRQLAEREISYGFLGMALTLCGASIVLTFFRWYLLVAAQNFPFAISDAIRLGFIGVLFNYVAPGAAGGDLVKAVMIAREQSSRKTVAVATVLLDRILGLLALFIVGAVASFFCSELSENSEAQALIAILVSGTVVGSLAIGLLLWPPFVKTRLVQSIQKIRLIGRPFSEVVNGIVLYQARPRVIVFAIVVSLVGHLGMLSSFYFCSLALQSGPAAPDYWEHLMLIPAAELASVVIPTPGGVGALEGAIIYVYQLANKVASPSQPADVVGAAGLFTALAFRSVSVAVSMVGAGYYLVSRRQIQQALDGQETMLPGQKAGSTAPSDGEKSESSTQD